MNISHYAITAESYYSLNLKNGAIHKAKKKIYVFQVSALKKLGMVGRKNILSKYFI